MVSIIDIYNNILRQLFKVYCSVMDSQDMWVIRQGKHSI
jgi:hypothetical protein